MNFEPCSALFMRGCYAEALYRDPDATLDDLRESVETLEETSRTARRVLGGAHPVTAKIEHDLRNARAALRARETPEKLAQDAFRTARAKLAQERAELAKTLADASARPSEDACDEISREDLAKASGCTVEEIDG